MVDATADMSVPSDNKVRAKFLDQLKHLQGGWLRFVFIAAHQVVLAVWRGVGGVKTTSVIPDAFACTVSGTKTKTEFNQLSIISLKS